MLPPPRTRYLRRRPSVVTKLGRTVLAACVVAGSLGWFFGWAELILRSALCAALLLFASTFTLGATKLRITLDVQPRRVVAGSSTAGQVHVTNTSPTRVLPLTIEVPLGEHMAVIGMPSLRSSAAHEEIFLVSTPKRGVIAIGPATAVRGDPLGLFRRTKSWEDAVEVYVHPKTVPIGGLTTGLLRDLEGHASNAMSSTDLSFHALRKYVPGDDRRAIHWRSSAKLAHTTEDGDFLVRQYLDTRRPYVTVVVDTAADAYADTDADFETALSATASLLVQARAEQLPASVVIGDEAHHEAPVAMILDSFARVTLADCSLLEQVLGASTMAPNTSLAILVTGSNTDVATLRRAAHQFTTDAHVLIIVVDAARKARRQVISNVTVLVVPELAALPLLLKGVMT